MDEYDPAAADAYDPAVAMPDYQYQEADDADGDDDEDYDPSTFAVETEPNEALTTAPSQPAQQTRPKTVGGFIVDDDDDEEEEQDAGVPTPTQLNGAADESSHVDAVTAPVESNTVIASEPSQEDASAPSTALLNGSSSDVVPAPVPNTESPSVSAPVPAPAFSFQSPTDQGKQATSITASAVPSATATPQPPVSSAPPQRTANTSVPPLPTPQRLPNDKVGLLEDRIKEDPKADTAAWRELIKHYREKGQLDNARKVYARFFEVFPSAVSQAVPKP